MAAIAVLITGLVNEVLGSQGTPFAVFVEDELTDCESFTFSLVNWFAADKRLATYVYKDALVELGYVYEGREKERYMRTFGSNSHDRWSGNPCAGGSGTSRGTWTGAGNASHGRNDR
jgi:hypothetical protein